MDGVGERKAEVRVEEAVNKEQKAEGRGGMMEEREGLTIRLMTTLIR